MGGGGAESVRIYTRASDRELSAVVVSRFCCLCGSPVVTKSLLESSCTCVSTLIRNFVAWKQRACAEICTKHLVTVFVGV